MCQQRAPPPSRCRRRGPQPSPGPPLPTRERLMPPGCGLDVGGRLSPQRNAMRVRQEASPEAWSGVDVGKKCLGVQAVSREGRDCARSPVCKKVPAGQRGLCHISGTSGCCGAAVTQLGAATCFPPGSPRETPGRAPRPPTPCSWRLRLQERACLCNSAVSLSALEWARVGGRCPAGSTECRLSIHPTLTESRACGTVLLGV